MLNARPWIGRVDHAGRILWRQSRSLQSELLQIPGRHVAAKIRVLEPLTAERMAYWFAVPVNLISKITGYTQAQTHMFLVANCFGVMLDKTTGIQVLKQPSTTKLTAADWRALVAWVHPWAKKTYGLELEAPRHLPQEPQDAESTAAFEDAELLRQRLHTMGPRT